MTTKMSKQAISATVARRLGPRPHESHAMVPPDEACGKLEPIR
jgi:hypothetical protein